MNRRYNILKVMIPLIKCFRKSSPSAIYSRCLSALPKTKYYVLSNGLTVATEVRPCNNVCMGLYIDAGSRHENESENGITHFFEHIAFKGTHKRSKTVLENEISKTGAKFKCFTTRDITAYYVECLSSDVNRVAEILFDCIFHNAYNETEIEIQKCVVYPEMLEHDKISVEILYDYLHSAAFQGTRLSQTVMGPTNNLHNLKSTSICDYMTNILSRQNIVFAAVGGVKHDVMINLGEQYYFRADSNAKCVDLGPKRYTGSQIVYRDDSMNMAHIAIAVEGPSFDDKDKLSMDLASYLLGGWDPSQPGGTNHGVNITNISSSGGLCQSHKVFSFYYQDVGLWGVEFISPKSEVDDMLMLVQKEWMRLCHLITDNELIRAKNEMKSRILMQFQTTTEACHDIGINFLRRGCRPDINKTISAIDEITANDLKKVCDTYIYDRCPVVVGIGATECLLSYPRIRGYMYWLRV